MLPRIDRRLCNQQIVLKIPDGERDRYGRTKTITKSINHVLVQPQTIYSGDSNSRKVTANAVVFLFAQITEPMPNLDKDSVGWKLEFEGNEYTITNLVDNREPFSNKVYSYELEVL